MFLEDPFNKLVSGRTWLASDKWYLAHCDVIHQFKAALYHFGRMRRENLFGNFYALHFEYDAFIWSLYSIRDHLLQEINQFFNLGIKEKSINFGEVKEKLQNQSQNTAIEIMRILDKLSSPEWFRFLKMQRDTITHRISPPKILGGSVSLSWDNKIPKVMLNQESIKLFGENKYREAIHKFNLDWLATSWISIELFKKHIESLWSKMKSMGLSDNLFLSK